MNFSDIRDQHVAVRFLRQVLAQKRMPNGALFWGPEGVGKRSTAIAFAKALNCSAGKDDACGECLSCRKIEHGNHPDLKIIKPTGKTRTIKVALVDEMIDLSSYRPFEAAWRVFIIQDAERMNEPSQNHFLKTLEEPPSATVFLLLSEFPRMLLPTIRSRCQQVRFGALRMETVKSVLLAQRDLPETVAEAIAAISQGQMSRAFDFVDSGKREVVIDVAKRLSAGDDPLALASEFARHLDSQSDALKASLKEEAPDDPQDMTAKEREDRKEELDARVIGLIRRQVMEYLYLFDVWYRDALVINATSDDSRILNRDHLEDLRRVNMQGDDGARIAAIEKARLYIERNLSMERIFRDLFFVLGKPTTAAR